MILLRRNVTNENVLQLFQESLPHTEGMTDYNSIYDQMLRIIGAEVYHASQGQEHDKQYVKDYGVAADQEAICYPVRYIDFE